MSLQNEESQESPRPPPSGEEPLHWVFPPDDAAANPGKVNDNVYENTDAVEPVPSEDSMGDPLQRQLEPNTASTALAVREHLSAALAGIRERTGGTARREPLTLTSAQCDVEDRHRVSTRRVLDRVVQVNWICIVALALLLVVAVELLILSNVVASAAHTWTDSQTAQGQAVGPGWAAVFEHPPTVQGLLQLVAGIAIGASVPAIFKLGLRKGRSKGPDHVSPE